MPEMPSLPGAVIVISSHVVRGKVGNRAAVFALETLGHPVWALPTVILPWHPGHGRSTRVTIPDADFQSVIDDLIAAPWVGEVRAVLSGYLGSTGQAEGVARLVAALRERNPKLIYACDPVIGDAGGSMFRRRLRRLFATDCCRLPIWRRRTASSLPGSPAPRWKRIRQSSTLLSASARPACW